MVLFWLYGYPSFQFEYHRFASVHGTACGQSYHNSTVYILSVQIFNTHHLIRTLCMLIYNFFSTENNSFVSRMAIFASEQERTKSVDIKAGKIRMSEYWQYCKPSKYLKNKDPELAQSFLFYWNQLNQISAWNVKPEPIYQYSPPLSRCSTKLWNTPITTEGYSK